MGPWENITADEALLSLGVDRPRLLGVLPIALLCCLLRRLFAVFLALSEQLQQLHSAILRGKQKEEVAVLLKVLVPVHGKLDRKL